MKRSIHQIIGIALIGSISFLTGCAYDSSSADVYTASQAQKEASIRFGTVDSVRNVTILANDGQPSGLGTLGGGALGAVAASAIGGGRGSLISGIAGGLVGAIAGNTIENQTAKHKGVEITVRLDNGQLVAITQATSKEIFRAGDRVRIIYSNGVSRVTH